jgi:hypothetical protein
MPRVGAPLPEDLLDILHPWSDGMFACGTSTFRTLEGAYQAHRGPAFERGYENLSGGQAWAKGARRQLPHRLEALRTAVEARSADLPLFQSAVMAHVGPFRVWHQERQVGKALEILYSQLRASRTFHQQRLDMVSPPLGEFR